MRRSYLSAILIILPIVFIFTFVVVGAVSLLEDSIFEASRSLLGHRAFLETGPTPTARPAPVASISLQGEPARVVPFRSVALGFAVDYPAGWRKRETTLEVAFSPTSAGLEAGRFQDGVIKVGIPAGDVTDPEEILEEVINDFPAGVERVDRRTMTIAAKNWSAVRLRFEYEEPGKLGLATVAATSKNGVGYFIAAMAPAERWNSFEPFFQSMVNSFDFVAEAEIPPTPTGSPQPTPTATPTPVIYVVQSGDTLSGIAARFGVDMEALAVRNGIEPPYPLRTEQKLVIPLRRRR